MIGKRSWKNEFKGGKNEEENLRPRERLEKYISIRENYWSIDLA